MIITKLNGGLGNQMFQYAAGKRLAIKNNTELKIDNTEYQANNYRAYGLNNFNIIENIATQSEIAKIKKSGFLKIIDSFKPNYKRSTVRHHKYNFYPNLLKIKDHTYLDGNWQNEKYFLDIKEGIIKDFTLKNPIDNKYPNLISQIKNTNSVSLHIRRGDYITNKKFSKVYSLLDEKYYKRAVKFIAEKISDPRFFIFSDDIKWVKQNLNISYPKIFVSDENETKNYEELILMSLCKHNIIANSSFSWWGAWLNQNPDKTVVVPKNWFKIQSCNEKYELPKTWCILENN